MNNRKVGISMSEIGRMSEKELRERLRKKFKTLQYKLFPLGNQATFDDLFISKKINGKILAIIDYKVESLNEGKRLTEISDEQMQYSVQDEYWKDICFFIILLRQPKTLQDINEIFKQKPRKDYDYL